jgi:GTP-binding protein Era
VLGDVDVVLFLVEAGKFTLDDAKVLALIPPGKPVLLVANKLDLVHRRADILPWLQEHAGAPPFTEFVPMSAKVEDVRGCSASCAAPARAGVVVRRRRADRPQRPFLASELIREKLFRLTGDELPYTSTVVIDKYEEEGNLRRIAATIVVERDAHKGMVIGEGGERLKRIGSEARQELEKLTDARSSWSCGSRCARAGPTTRSTCAATATSAVASSRSAPASPAVSCCTSGTGARPA